MDLINDFIIDNIFEIVIECDMEGTICRYNRQACSNLGYSMDELKGKNIEELFLDKSVNLAEKISKCKESILEVNHNIYRNNKTCFPVISRFVYDKDKDHVIIISLDDSKMVNVRKEADYINEKINEALKIKDEFTASVTHELRTPVNGIKGHAQYLLMTDLNKDQKKEVGIINDCCSNMEKLINNILDFSKLEAGKFELNEKEFSFNECIEHIAETTGKLIEDKGLRFILNIDSSIPEKIYGDDFRLTQVLNNLLSNALKFTSKGYIALDISKTMQRDHDIELFFMIMDTGIGIKENKKEVLFNSFKQADSGISRAYGGTGLGLSISKQLVELMDGSIRVESEYGKGSSFSFSVRMKIPSDVKINQNAEVKSVPHIDHENRMRKLMEENTLLSAYGSRENNIEIERICEKLSLCIDMENYEKAEGLAASLKNLVVDGPEDVKKTTFRIQMMIRKEDGESAKTYLEKLSELLNGA